MIIRRDCIKNPENCKWERHLFCKQGFEFLKENNFFLPLSLNKYASIWSNRSSFKDFSILYNFLQRKLIASKFFDLKSKRRQFLMHFFSFLIAKSCNKRTFPFIIQTKIAQNSKINYICLYVYI